MKIILTKDVSNLGNAGEIKEVASGYARNFLIPNGCAKVATKALIKQAEELRIKKEKQAEEKLKTAQTLAEKLKNASVHIKAKADKTGKLYASVSSENISKALAEKGFDVKKNNIVIEKPIKEIGSYRIAINFGYGFETKISVIVESDT